MKSYATKFVLSLAVGCCLKSQAQISTNVGDLYDAPRGPKLTDFHYLSRIELFNGTNFDGFTFCMRSNADPALTWSVTNGVIHCNGSAIGYLRTEQSFSNYALAVEWRFREVTPKANNTGVLVHMQAPPDKVWPPCIQNQGKSGRQGDLIFMAGAESKEHLALNKDASAPVPLHGEPNENAVGEWNTNVTICAGNNVKAVINGKALNMATECTLTSGAIGIQSENADFEIRKMYLEPLESTETFNVITDTQTGRYAIIDSNRVVTLMSRDGKVIWSTNITKFVKTNRIFSVDVSGKHIIISPANESRGTEIMVDKETGKVGIIVY